MGVLSIAVFCLSACDNELDIQQAYPFTIETMPVQKHIAKGQTAEIRCTLKREAKATAGGNDFFTQDEESLNVPTGSNTDKNSQAAEQQRLAQEARAAEQKAKSDRAKNLGVNAQ